MPWLDCASPRRLVLALVFTAPSIAMAQAVRPGPSHSFVLSGYGTAGLLKAEGNPSASFASLAPILLFRMTAEMFAEAELEFELEDGATRTGLEYATVHFLASDRLTVSAGKFLLPFRVFGQRLHPTWINRFASGPPIFGHGEGITGIEPLLPIISDIGVMATVVLPLGGIGRSVTANGFVTNGPRAEAGHAGEEEAQMISANVGGEGGEMLPELGFGEFASDNNGNKMVGGRLGLVLAPSLEVDVSAMYAKWGEAEVQQNAGKGLGFWGYNLAAEYRTSGLEFRGEWFRTGTEIEEIGLGGDSEIEIVKRWGGYAQGTYRRGAWEPVVRVSLIDPNEGEPMDRLTQYGLGLNYWFSPSVAIMASFELNRDKFAQGQDLPNNRFLIHWAFGF